MKSSLCSCSGRNTSAAMLCIVALGCCVVASRVRADGAFADSKAIMLPRDKPHRVLSSLDVPGLVVSDDDGKTWSWICENAIGRFAGLFQQGPVPDENLYAITQAGLSISTDAGCSWQRPDGPTKRAGDVFPDPSDATRVLSVVQTTSADSPEYGDGVVRSDDAGKTFGATMYSTTDASITGIEVARSDSSLIYLAMSSLQFQRPYIVRSSDAGNSWSEINLTTQLERKPLVIRIIAVDPNDARTLYLRVSDGQRDALAISHDAGDTLQVVTQLEAKMSAFLLRADGSILLASSDGQSFRSSDAGASFEPWTTAAGALHFQALGERDGVLYATTTSRLDGFAIAVSDDDGESWRPLLRLSQLRGPLRCGSIAQQCQSEWTQLERVLPALSGPPLTASSSAHAHGSDCSMVSSRSSLFGSSLLLWAATLYGWRRKVRRRVSYT